jgi:hypothetical protein
VDHHRHDHPGRGKKGHPHWWSWIPRSVSVSGPPGRRRSPPARWRPARPA